LRGAGTMIRANFRAGSIAALVAADTPKRNMNNFTPAEL